ncbi:hypothetical protein EPI10_016318 [Gossypium australe]|uniref:Uncharacterized protein n=1 Tax=Gossypium australe TaxID=47621 RepID=A0A5B6VNR1_9ROSI|nr:hypothetical protein EPI10_016318 [Gossypium australe]
MTENRIIPAKLASGDAYVFTIRGVCTAEFPFIDTVEYCIIYFSSSLIPNSYQASKHRKR